MPEFLLPFGPFHMVLLHLPIGALTAIWFVELLLEDKGDKHKNQAIGLLHLLLLLSCALTIALGLAYEDFGQYGDEIEEHELWGYIFGGGVFATYILYWINRKAGKLGTKFVYMLGLLATTIAMIITGHQGGELIHGKGFLFKPFQEDKRRVATPAPAPIVRPVPTERANSDEPMPEPNMQSMEPMTGEMMDSMQPMMDAPLPTPAPEPAASEAEPRIARFEATQAIFKRNCYKCHGATKQKGDYRLDSKHSINQGGKSKLAAIVPGKAEESELMYRMLLPRSDDDAMPPEEKDPVSAEDIDTVRQWIESGAYWPDEKERSTAPAEYVKVGDVTTDELIAQINTTGVKAEYNAWGDESVRVDLGVVEPGQLDTALKALEAFGSKLSWLDASHLELPEGFFQLLQQFSNLQRLHLDGSNVTDAQLEQLSQLPKLAYLNLYNTQISDQGAAALKNCANLQKVYLSATKVTTKGIRALKDSKPELTLVHR